MPAGKIQPPHKLQRFVSPALILVGIMLLIYVGIEYGQMYAEQHRLAREWEQQQNKASDPNSGTSSANVSDSGLIRLVIPKISLTSFIVEGTNHRSLLVGPGHVKDTPEPGQLGNAVISAHRDTFFRHLHELEKGDQMIVERAGKEYHYEITGKKIVDPSDVSVMHRTPDAQLTLITCYPTYYIGPAPKRLVIFSKMVGDGPTQNAEALESSAATRVKAVGATQ